MSDSFSSCSAVTPHGWKWPLELNAYDRSPHLTETEQAELRSWRQGVEAGKTHWYDRTHRLLRRLLVPIQEALNVAQPARMTASRASVMRVMLWEMDARQTSYWQWGQAEWLQIFGNNHKRFNKHYSTPMDTRSYVLAVSYLLCGFDSLHATGPFNQPFFAAKVFGQSAVDEAVDRVQQELLRWGCGENTIIKPIRNVVCEALVFNRSPLLEDLTADSLERLRQEPMPAYIKKHIRIFSRALTSLGILAGPIIPPVRKGQEFGTRALVDVPVEWSKWCERWRQTAPYEQSSRRGIYYQLLKVGRWLAVTHPHATTPEQWDRELAAEFVAAVGTMIVGQWSGSETRIQLKRQGQPLSPRAKSSLLAAIRLFFRDCQEWNWCPRCFDPGRAFASPRALRAQAAPNPRPIQDDIWAKLLWAGLNLTLEDLPFSSFLSGGRRTHLYPIEMVRAIVIVWLFSGLRVDEICRLRIDCIRWQQEDVIIPGTQEVLPKDAVCMLSVPVNKTSSAFVKPVDRVIGEAIQSWVQVRPPQPATLDAKTGEKVDLLFAYRGKRLGKAYINQTVIPALCKKAGIMEKDAQGPITSHRARSTIATHLFNAREPLTLFELQRWLGHRSPWSTQHYAKLSPTKLAASYAKAGYFERNLRTIEVLIDQEVIQKGTETTGEPWKYYDLGHGYCTYDFFDQCPHRMACARCSFYRPKDDLLVQFFSAKTKLQKMLQEIPLTDPEREAVDGDIKALESLCSLLKDIPTPEGPTPRQLSEGAKPLLPVVNVTTKRGKLNHL